MDSSTPTVKTGGAIIAVLALGGITASITQSMVVPLIADLPRILDTSSSNAAWVITATLLTSSVCVPVSGRLGDLYGKRRMLLVCTIPLIVGSVICALSTTVLPMIIGRCLQGMGMGMVSLGVSALRELLPPERLGSGIALISSSLGIGAALGLPVAATVIGNANWRVLFWGVAVLAAVIALLIWRIVPPTPGRQGGKFDFVGGLGLGIALVCLLLGVSKGADWGWGSGLTLGLLAMSVVVLLVWGWWELRTDQPLVDLRVTARPTVLMTNIASIVLGLAMYAQSLILPQLLQLPSETGYGLGQSMLQMGLWMAPAGLMMMATSPLGARLSAIRGPKVTLVAGALIMSLGYGSSLFLFGSPWTVTLVSCICMTGLGLAYGAMPALIMGAVPVSETGSANSFNTLMRAVGSSICAAMVGVVLSQMTIDFGGRTVPSEAGIHTAMLIGCGLALAAAVVASMIPVRRAGRPAERQGVPVEPSKVAVS
ncbi:MAG TPA: MFS transporter [Yinghuangia sp.]|uniref:MFS transporter n=1 Tax=Yinghuangia sp. YIM S10712 TaxID=3436930 RepID=UPI002C03CED2|nr:MFS transporter [Yinghuangia sp.]